MKPNSENIDAAELDKFETSAAHWWDPEGEFKPLHIINPVRLDYVDTRAPLAGKTVLDVGCGGGLLSEAMARRGAKVTGIDMGANAIDVAKLHLHISQLEVDYRIANVQDVAAETPGEYDIVTCMELLEHVPSPAALISACAVLTKPGGDVFFSTINRNPASYALAIVAAEYILSLLPGGTHEYMKFIKPSELASAARASGLAVRDISGMRYNPLTERADLSKLPLVNYLMHCRKD